MHTKWDGQYWAVRQDGTTWILSRERKGRMFPIEERIVMPEGATLPQVVEALDARQLAQMGAERAKSIAARQTPVTGPTSTTGVGAIIGALDRGMPLAQVEAAVEGRPYKPGRTVLRCPKCRATGYAGEYPFSTGYGSLCDDCGA